jgi:hypothetical protein
MPAFRLEGRMVKISRYAYLGASWLFLAGVIAQVFLAGMVVVALRMNWNLHRDTGHTIGLPLLIMLITMYLGRMPVSLKRLTWLLFGVYFLQADVVIFLRAQAPVISALHPVLALFDFAIGWILARRAWPLAREVQTLPRAESPAITR